MSLVWHIAKKDLRRMALPVALWCVPGVLRVVLPWLVLGSVVTDAAGYRLWEAMILLLVGLDIVVEVILVAALTHEDVPTGTTAWWPTRPIAGGRLLQAKLLGGAVLFLLVPLVPLSVAWFAAGFSAREWLGVVAWFAITRGLIGLVALGLAAAAENLVQFLFGTIVLSFAFVLLAAYADWGGFLGLAPVPGPVRYSGQQWMEMVVLGCTVTLFAHQYLTRRRERTLTILAAALALIVGLRFWWNGTSQPIEWMLGDTGFSLRETGNESVKLDGLAATVKGGTATLRFTITGMPDGSYAWPGNIRGYLGGGSGSEILFTRRVPSTPPERVAALAVAGLPQEDDGNTWTLSGSLPARFANTPPESAALQGSMWLRSMRGQLMGELPLRPGSELSVGSSLTRILDFHQEDEKFVVTLVERDALSSRIYWPDLGPVGTRPNANDYYLLVNRSKGLVQVLEAGDLHGLVAGLIVTGQRQLVIAPPDVPGWEQGAVLIKVRFALDHYFTRPFIVERITPGS